MIRSRNALWLTVAAVLGTVMLATNACSGEKSGAAKAPQSPSAAPAASASVAQSDTAKTQSQLVVYYFCTNFRCGSCKYIEQNTEAALKEAFAGELASGRIVFKMLNIEEDTNKHFVDDYKLATKSVVVSELKGGTQTRWKNLEQVWQLLRDDKKFHEYIIKEVNAYLAG